jgi:adenylate cyclase
MERKLAAILSADIAGYSRLMAYDQEATVRTLTAYREQIEALVREHRGRVADFSGDNFLAEFPTAIGAVECAIEIQRVLRARNADIPEERKMQFRIGAHMGDVAVDGDRLYGDGVNIAARLEALAEPGGICISATVHEQVRNKASVAYDDLGDQTVKNIPDQVHVYRIDLEGRPGETQAAAGASPLLRRLAMSAAAIALLALVIWAAWPRIVGLGLDAAGLGGPPTNPDLPAAPSLVVLPFANMSDDREQEYFSDGITEDLTNALAGNPHLFGRSRTSRASSECGTCSRAAFARRATACASRRSSSTRRRASTSGAISTIASSTTSSRCSPRSRSRSWGRSAPRSTEPSSRASAPSRPRI